MATKFGTPFIWGAATLGLAWLALTVYFHAAAPTPGRGPSEHRDVAPSQSSGSPQDAVERVRGEASAGRDEVLGVPPPRSKQLVGRLVCAHSGLPVVGNVGGAETTTSRGADGLFRVAVGEGDPVTLTAEGYVSTHVPWSCDVHTTLALDQPCCVQQWSEATEPRLFFVSRLAPTRVLTEEAPDAADDADCWAVTRPEPLVLSARRERPLGRLGGPGAAAVYLHPAEWVIARRAQEWYESDGPSALRESLLLRSRGRGTRIRFTATQPQTPEAAAGVVAVPELRAWGIDPWKYEFTIGEELELPPSDVLMSLEIFSGRHIIEGARDLKTDAPLLVDPDNPWLVPGRHVEVVLAERPGGLLRAVDAETGVDLADTLIAVWHRYAESPEWSPVATYEADGGALAIDRCLRHADLSISNAERPNNVEAAELRVWAPGYETVVVDVEELRGARNADRDQSVLLRRTEGVRLRILRADGTPLSGSIQCTWAGTIIRRQGVTLLPDADGWYVAPVPPLGFALGVVRGARWGRDLMVVSPDLTWPGAEIVLRLEEASSLVASYTGVSAAEFVAVRLGADEPVFLGSHEPKLLPKVAAVVPPTAVVGSTATFSDLDVGRYVLASARLTPSELQQAAGTMRDRWIELGTEPREIEVNINEPRDEVTVLDLSWVPGVPPQAFATFEPRFLTHGSAIVALRRGKLPVQSDGTVLLSRGTPASARVALWRYLPDGSVLSLGTYHPSDRATVELQDVTLLWRGESGAVNLLFGASSKAVPPFGCRVQATVGEPLTLGLIPAEYDLVRWSVKGLSGEVRLPASPGHAVGESGTEPSPHLSPPAHTQMGGG